jgi:hypothetical protein
MTTRELITNEYNADAERIRLHQQLVAVLTRFDGKKLTRRVKDAVQAAFPTATVGYVDVYSWIDIELWGGEVSAIAPTYPDRISFNLGYKDRGVCVFSLERFAYTDARNGSAAIERNRKRHCVLGENLPEEIDAAIAQYHAAKARVDALLSDLPDASRITEMYNPRQR